MLDTLALISSRRLFQCHIHRLEECPLTEGGMAAASSGARAELRKAIFSRVAVSMKGRTCAPPGLRLLLPHTLRRTRVYAQTPHIKRCVEHACTRRIQGCTQERVQCMNSADEGRACTGGIAARAEGCSDDGGAHHAPDAPEDPRRVDEPQGAQALRVVGLCTKQSSVE